MNPNKRPDPSNLAHQIVMLLDGWDMNAHTGQFGSKRDELFATLNEQHGPGNWWFGWKMPSGEVWTFTQVFWGVYVDGYEEYFNAHPDEAEYLASNFSYAYDLTEIPEPVAYDPTALVNVPGLPNQFHHVALNLVINGRPGGWRGGRPIQVRGPGTEGEQWSPGHIPARPDYVDYADAFIEEVSSGWWEPGSIESVYQLHRKLFIRTVPDS